jgi:hypothetical protein
VSFEEARERLDAYLATRKRDPDPQQVASTYAQVVQHAPRDIAALLARIDELERQLEDANITIRTLVREPDPGRKRPIKAWWHYSPDWCNHSAFRRGECNHRCGTWTPLYEGEPQLKDHSDDPE